jgi:hypothetical protein
VGRRAHPQLRSHTPDDARCAKGRLSAILLGGIGQENRRTPRT